MGVRVPANFHHKSKQKIKCIMANDEPPCTRCVHRGLSCVLNKSLQSLVDDTRQIEALQGDVINLHAILTQVCRATDIATPPPLQISTPCRLQRDEDGNNVQSDANKDDPEGADVSPPMSPSDMQAPIDTFLETASKVAESPISAVVESPRGSVGSRKNAPEPDLIGKGIITSATSEKLVSRYLERLDHYLYGIGGVYTDMKSLRKASPVLLAAVCAISALHDERDMKLYEACSHEFLSLVSKSMFEERGVEFLRALCIGSYWLSDASRILNGDALRRAADVRLQKYFFQVTVPDSTVAQPGGILLPAAKVDRVRLWYLLYICDQHLSILYNRDSIVHGNHDIILGWETFLESGLTDDSDIRITSQVSLLQTMSQIRSAFGPESLEPVHKALVTSVNNFNRQIDQWFSRFSTVFSMCLYLTYHTLFVLSIKYVLIQPEEVHKKIGDFPYKGLTLHYHFAKLYLGHHVLRGLHSDPIPVYFLPAALMAHGAAISIFDFILNDSDLTSTLVGVPFYFHVMISFAGHFLLSCSQYRVQMSIDVDNDLSLLGKAIQIFRSVPCISHHPLQKMAAALQRRHFECQAMINRYNAQATSSGESQQINVSQWNNGVPPDASGGQPSNGIYGPGSSHAMNPPRSGDVANTATHANLGQIPDGYAMVPPPNGDAGLEMVFQDFGGFDFPDMQMQMNFAPQ